MAQSGAYGLQSQSGVSGEGGYTVDGVTILNTYMAWTRSITAIVVFFDLFLAVGIVCGIALLLNDEYLGGFVIGACIAGILLLFCYVPKTEHIQATLDDSVSYVELTDKYEIVKSDGRIITMIERKTKDNETSDDI